MSFFIVQRYSNYSHCLKLSRCCLLRSKKHSQVGKGLLGVKKRMKLWNVTLLYLFLTI